MERHSQPLVDRIGSGLGYLTAWTAMTLALTTASRTFHFGPGFANPLPYALLAFAISLVGRLLRKWLAS